MRAEAEGVPPRDRENSDTGPSYIPLGTALSTASYRTNKSRDGEERGVGEGIEEAQETGEEQRTGKNIMVFSATKVTKSTPVWHYT